MRLAKIASIAIDVVVYVFIAAIVVIALVVLL